MSGVQSTVSASNPLSATPQAIISSHSTSGYTPHPLTNSTTSLAKKTLSGVCTANVLQTILSVTGSGVLVSLMAQMVDITARTLRCRLTLDGVVVFDSTSASSTTAWAAAVIAGAYTGSNDIMVYPSAIPFASSMLFEVCSNLTETDKINIYYTYRTN